MRPPTRMLPRLHPRRLFSPNFRTYATSHYSSPAPPRLPKEDQELYERLQRSSTGAFSTPQPTVVVNQSPATASPSNSQQRQRPRINQSPHSIQEPQIDIEAVDDEAQSRDMKGIVKEVNARVRATGEGEELHPNVRRGALPEFEGERNPKTGETGGPKNDPLRWGGGVDWSYNGRVTDF